MIKQPGIPAEKLIQDLFNNETLDIRLNAAKTLSGLDESNEKTVLALLIAKEIYGGEVKDIITKALVKPVHQKIIEQKPELVDLAVKMANERQSQESGKSSIKTGCTLLIIGFLALLACMSGYDLVLFKFIRFSNPVWGISFIVLGILMLVAGYIIRNDKKH